MAVIKKTYRQYSSEVQYRIGDKNVTEDEYHEALEDFVQTLVGTDYSESIRIGGTSWANPVHSEALAVHPSLIEEAAKDAQAKGVPTEFDSSGRPIFRDRAHRKAYCEQYAYFDRSAGYADAQRGKYQGKRESDDSSNIFSE